MRWLRHLFAAPARVRYPDPVLDRIGQAIAAGERLHGGQLVFAVEASLPLAAVLRGQDAAARAAEVFAQLRVWDTADNNGVLLYLLLADHAIEIVADRGLHGRVAPQQWQEVCAELGRQLRQGPAEAALVAAVERISALLATHFPGGGEGGEGLPDRPVRL